MHDSVMDFLRESATADRIAGKIVLEIGSKIEGQSPRAIIESMQPAKYIGIDMQPGSGVDQVMKCEDLIFSMGANCADFVLCCGTLEHMEKWKDCLWNMICAVKYDGHFLLTVPSPGFPRHNYPSDYWRFTIQDVETIAETSGLDTIVLREDKEQPGVMFLAKRTEASSRRYADSSYRNVHPQEAPR